MSAFSSSSFKPMKIICISSWLMFLQLILCWSMAPKNASTWWGTHSGFSPKRPGSTWRRSWRSGPKRTCPLLNSSFINMRRVFSYSVRYQLCCRGVHGHTGGSRPWAWAENNIEELMANVVGKRRRTLNISCFSANWLFFIRSRQPKVKPNNHLQTDIFNQTMMFFWP